MFGAFSGSKSAPSSAAHSGPSVAAKKGHVIVIGNEKGGSGKTTTTMHLIVGLLRLGFSIGSIDIDSRQRSLTRYVENRQNMASREGVKLPMPQHVVVTRSPFGMQEEAEADERDRFSKAIHMLMANNDFVVIDSPGSDTYLSRFAHSFADTIITPINDSFVDLDVLATVDGTTLKIVRPSIYSEMVWEQKLLRAKRDGGSIEWIVMRNRLSNIDARNKRFMGQVLAELSRRIGFRAAPGFSERVIFREMFLQGLTVLDVMDNGTNTSISLSHVAARQEVRDLLKILRIPQIDERVASMRTGQEELQAQAAAEAAAAADAPATIRPAAQRPATQPAARSPMAASAPPIAQPINQQPSSAAPASAGSMGFAPPPPPPGTQAAAAAPVGLNALNPVAKPAETKAAAASPETVTPREVPAAATAAVAPSAAPAAPIAQKADAMASIAPSAAAPRAFTPQPIQPPSPAPAAQPAASSAPAMAAPAPAPVATSFSEPAANFSKPTAMPAPVATAIASPAEAPKAAAPLPAAAQPSPAPVASAPTAAPRPSTPFSGQFAPSAHTLAASRPAAQPTQAAAQTQTPQSYMQSAFAPRPAASAPATPSIAPSQHAPASQASAPRPATQPTAPAPTPAQPTGSVAREGNFLMSTSMLQQAASAIRSAAKSALTQPIQQEGRSEGEWSAAPPAPRDLPELEVRDANEWDQAAEQRARVRDLEAAS